MGRKNKNRNKGAQPNPQPTDLKVHEPKEETKPEPNTMKSLAHIEKMGQDKKAAELPKKPEPKKNPQATVQSHDPKSTEAYVLARKAAAEAIEFMCQDMKEHLSTVFWEDIRDAAISKVGIPLAPTVGIKPLDEKQARDFEKERMEEGRYVDKTILHVRKKDAEYLKNFQNQPSRFQKMLRRYHAFLQIPKQPVKKDPSTKAV